VKVSREFLFAASGKQGRLLRPFSSLRAVSSRHGATSEPGILRTMIKSGVHDVLIVGGGLTGLSLALSLRGAGLRVVLVETTAVQAKQTGFDDRHLALSLASVQALRGLGLQAALDEQAQPIFKLEVRSSGEFGSVEINAADYGLPYLGLVCPAHRLGAALLDAAAGLTDMAYVRGTTLLGLARDADYWCAELEGPEGKQELKARLVVGSDGTASRVRDLIGLSVRTQDYAQRAIVSNIELTRISAGTAHERLTREGPLALLPLPGNRVGVVWTRPAAVAESLLAMSDQAFTQALQAALGFAHGRIRRVGARVSYPLALQVGEITTAWRAALIGNAAQTIHPIAAQGFNLGLRDALALAGVIREHADDPGSDAVLQGFAKLRQRDRERTIRFSDGLVALTGSRLPFASMLRSAGLIAIDRIGPLKRAVLEFGLGFARSGE